MDSYGEYGITATQYHAGLDKLWKALAISCAQGRDVFTLCSERIAYLESEVERLRVKLEMVDEENTKLCNMLAAMQKCPRCEEWAAREMEQLGVGLRDRFLADDEGGDDVQQT